MYILPVESISRLHCETAGRLLSQRQLASPAPVAVVGLSSSNMRPLPDHSSATISVPVGVVTADQPAKVVVCGSPQPGWMKLPLLLPTSNSAASPLLRL